MRRFEGLSDLQWKVLEPLLPKEGKRGKGKPHTPWRKVLNTILWVLINGARWCDVPKGSQWGSRSASHRWLGIWGESGLIKEMLRALQELASLSKLMDLERLHVDGFYSSGKGGGDLVDYGYKGKGVTSHLLIDNLGNPLGISCTGASGDERKEVLPLIKKNHPMG